MAITAAGIGLPEFQQGTANRLASFVKHATMNDDSLSDGTFSGPGVVVDQVIVQLADHRMAEYRAGDFRDRAFERQKSALR
ncbi:hypothetical protein D3C80_519850 [compost metagenome]